MEQGTFLNLLGFSIIVVSLFVRFLGGEWKIELPVFVLGALIQSVGLFMGRTTVHMVCGAIMLTVGIGNLLRYRVLINNEREKTAKSREPYSHTGSSGSGTGH